MKSIVIFAGTTEGRELAKHYMGSNLLIHICVATEYGSNLIEEADNIIVHCRRMDENQIEKFLLDTECELCIDCTHPYADIVTENVYRACQNTGVIHIRVKRESMNVENTDNIIYVDNAQAAIDYLDNKNGNILLTTGSKTLMEYTRLKDFATRCVVRVLPTPEVMKECEQAGILGKNIIAMQGPFSYEMNRELIRQYSIKYLVTKDSGLKGGFGEKLEACRATNTTAIVIGRPKEPECITKSLAEVVEYIDNKYQINPTTNVYLLGMGPGDIDYLTLKGKSIIEKCQAIAGAKRIIDNIETDKKKVYIGYKYNEIIDFIKENRHSGDVAVLFTGDIGIYSGAIKLHKELENIENIKIHTVSGISSIAYLCNTFAIPLNEVKILSCHGKECNIIGHIWENEHVCAIVSTGSEINQLCQKLLYYDMKQVELVIGENLSYRNERFVMGTPRELMEESFDNLSVVYINNPYYKTYYPGMKDESFIRGEVPMTKENIRALIMSKLRLNKASVVLDIGAGTGSVSVEMSKQSVDGRIYSIEKNAEAISLLEANAKKHVCDNMKIYHSEALEFLENMEALDMITHAFIGGSGNRLEAIIDKLLNMNPQMRIVITAIALETVGTLIELCKKKSFYNLSVDMITAAKSKKAGSYNLMCGENPVYIISFGGKCDE